MPDSFPISPQPDEPPKAWAACLVYLTLHPSNRSIRLAYEVFTGKHGDKKGKPPTVWEEWSSRFGWIERAKEYDSFMSHRFGELQFQKWFEAHDRLDKIGDRLTDLEEKILEKAHQIIDTGAASIDDLKTATHIFKTLTDGDKTLYDRLMHSLGLASLLRDSDGR
jgi:hypothetical protein